jgi:hypothetical protein
MYDFSNIHATIWGELKCPVCGERPDHGAFCQVNLRGDNRATAE